MNKTMQSSILSVIGAVTITACFTGIFTNFVKPSLRWYLVAAGAVLLLMGIYGVLTSRSEAAAEAAHEPADGEAVAPGHDDPSGHGHDHSKGPRIGWLMLAPFVLLGFVVPPPLGSYAAERDSGAVRASESIKIDSDLPTGKTVELSLTEYQMRAVYDDSKTLEGRTVRLVGFASPSSGETDWAVTRMKLSCCAADAYAVKVDALGAEAPAKDSWVAVTGTWEKTPGDPMEEVLIPRIRVTSIEPTEQPEIPYE